MEGLAAPHGGERRQHRADRQAGGLAEDVWRFQSVSKWKVSTEVRLRSSDVKLPEAPS
jgi:hypothetical protein